MAAPNSINNTRSQSTDTLYSVDGDRMGKRGIKPLAATGLDNDVGHAAVATHEAGTGKWAAGDPAAVIAGVDGTDVVPAQVDSTGRLVVASSAAGGALTDRSGTTSATPSTSTVVASALPGRKYLFFQNISDTDMWINFGGDANADQPSIRVDAGAAFSMEGSFVSGESLEVLCTSASKKFTCKEA